MDWVGSMVAVDAGDSALARGAAALAGGDLRASRRWYEDAYAEGEQAADGDLMAQAVLGLCGLWVPDHRAQVTASLLEARLRHALSVTEPLSQLGLRLRIMASGEADYRSGGSARVLGVLGQARTAGDPVALAEALSRAHHCLPGPEHGELRRTLADELVGVAARTGQDGQLLLGLLWLVIDLFLVGDPRAEGRLGELRALLAERSHLAISYIVRSLDVMLAIRAGRLAEAERLSVQCREAGVRAGDVDADGRYGAQLTTIRWYQGRLPELAPMLAGLAASATLSPADYSFAAAQAVAAAQAGDQLTAVRGLAAVQGRHLADLPRSGSWLSTMAGVAEAAYLLGDREAAAQAYELLLPFADQPMMAGFGTACLGSVSHALGLAQVTLGDLDLGAELLSYSLCRNLAFGHLPAVNVARLRFAEVLERRAQSGDLVMAIDLRSRAADLAARLGPEVGPTARRFAARCRRHGTKWRLELGPRSALIGNSVGMAHLAVLIANPGAEIAALDLVAGAERLTARAGAGGGGGQPVLDRAAVRTYSERLAQVREQAERLEAAGDYDGAARARAEQDWLMKELGASAGLAGRRRTFADAAERARIAVGRSIRRSLASIEAADAVIGAHLRTAVHTGAKCWYRPV